MAKDPKSNRRASRKHKLKSQYGITIEDFDQMMEDQGGVCAICGAPPSYRRLDIDHCHSSGKVRGLLCPNCNKMLGLVGDNIATLRSAINYLNG